MTVDPILNISIWEESDSINNNSITQMYNPGESEPPSHHTGRISEQRKKQTSNARHQELAAVKILCICSQRTWRDARQLQMISFFF